jgi:peptidoglycan/LPS O-acetylase OafA/YrhL
VAPAQLDDAHTPSPTDHSAYRVTSLDSLRGLAALAVFACHFLQIYPSAYSTLSVPSWMQHRPLGGPAGVINHVITWTPAHLLWGGQEAVLIFFVLSGYVLAMQFAEGREPHWRHFIFKRLCRLYPPFLVTLIVALVIRQIVLTLVDRLDQFALPWATPVDYLVIADHLFMLNRASANVIDPPMWSLVHEVRISMIFPLLVGSVLRFPAAITLPVAISLALASVTLVPADVYRSSGGEVVYSLCGTIFYSYFFVVGILAARYRSTLARLCRASSRLVQGGVIALALVLLNAQSNFGPGLASHPAIANLIEGLGAVILVVLASAADARKSILHWAPLSWVGKVSFSLYLLHVPILYAAASLCGPLWGGLAALAIIFPIAGLSYAWVEAPAIAFGRAHMNEERGVKPKRSLIAS